jgi:hypothetical protein
MYGINPGVYYMRVVASCSNFPDSSFGTLVYLTIGEATDSLYLTLGSIGPFCAGNTIYIYANPDRQGPPYNSTYQWWSRDKKYGTQPFNNWDNGYLAFYDNNADTLEILCQENNNGCLGSIAELTDTIIILGHPDITKTGPTSACVGDTGTYSVPLTGGATYYWKISSGVHADTSNNVLKVYFSATGTYRISVVALNACFTDSAVWNVTVSNPPPIPIITFNGMDLISNALSGNQWLLNNNTVKGATKDTLIPLKNGCYSVKVTNKSGCSSISDTICVVNASVQNIIAPLGISIFPNPNSGTFILNIENAAQPCCGTNLYFKITNELGQMIYEYKEDSFSGNFSKEINLNRENNGVYFVQVTIGNQTFNRKLVIVK